MEEKQDINSGKAIIFEDDEGRFTLTPRGCFATALCHTRIVDTDEFDLNQLAAFNSLFTVLVERFKRRGWIKYDDEKESDVTETRKDQEEVFVKTVRGFYPNATEEQASAAFDLFFNLLEKHGNTTETKNKL